MPNPIDITQGDRNIAEGSTQSAPGNDNLDEFDSLTKQGLVLLKAFHTIGDPEVRYRALCYIQSLADNQNAAVAVAARSDDP